VRDIARRRLESQHLIGAPLATPEAVVDWLGAVQAQDFAGAKWALALRTRALGGGDGAVERAFDDGRILRTHVMRPTWHFVRPADVRWLLALTAPRVRAAMAYYQRKRELDGKLLARCEAVLARALAGGRHLTREELGRALGAARIRASGERLGHILMSAELAAVVVSGPRRGKQFTYALLDERVPAARALAREAALAELARRYFRGHGPALVQDFAWWSGLTQADARAGVAAAGLAEERIDGQRYLVGAAAAAAVAPRRPVVHLLPNYDELLIAYRERSAALDGSIIAHLDARNTLLASHFVTRDGRLIGGWRRTLARGEVVIEARVPGALTRAEEAALAAAAERYGRFLGMPARLVRV